VGVELDKHLYYYIRLQFDDLGYLG